MFEDKWWFKEYSKLFPIIETDEDAAKVFYFILQVQLHSSFDKSIVYQYSKKDNFKGNDFYLFFQSEIAESNSIQDFFENDYMKSFDDYIDNLEGSHNYSFVNRFKTNFKHLVKKNRLDIINLLKLSGLVLKNVYPYDFYSSLQYFIKIYSSPQYFIKNDCFRYYRNAVLLKKNIQVLGESVEVHLKFSDFSMSLSDRVLAKYFLLWSVNGDVGKFIELISGCRKESEYIYLVKRTVKELEFLKKENSDPDFPVEWLVDFIDWNKVVRKSSLEGLRETVNCAVNKDKVFKDYENRMFDLMGIEY